MNIISPSAEFDWKLAQLVEGYDVGIVLNVAHTFDFHVDTIEYSSTSTFQGATLDSFVAFYGRRIWLDDEVGDNDVPRREAEHQEHICLVDIDTLVVY